MINPNLTMAVRAAGARRAPCDTSVGSGPKSAPYDQSAAKRLSTAINNSNRRARSQGYEQSAAIRPQNTMGARTEPRKPCDATSAVITTSKKFVTGDGAHAVARMARSGRREREGCGTGAGGRLTSPRPERCKIPSHLLAGHRFTINASLPSPAKVSADGVACPWPILGEHLPSGIVGE